jgi:hypothetical protein
MSEYAKNTMTKDEILHIVDLIENNQTEKLDLYNKTDISDIEYYLNIVNDDYQDFKNLDYLIKSETLEKDIYEGLLNSKKDIENYFKRHKIDINFEYLEPQNTIINSPKERFKIDDFEGLKLLNKKASNENAHSEINKHKSESLEQQTETEKALKILEGNIDYNGIISMLANHQTLSLDIDQIIEFLLKRGSLITVINALPYVPDFSLPEIIWYYSFEELKINNLFPFDECEAYINKFSNVPDIYKKTLENIRKFNKLYINNKIKFSEEGNSIFFYTSPRENQYYNDNSVDNSFKYMNFPILKSYCVFQKPEDEEELKRRSMSFFIRGKEEYSMHYANGDNGGQIFIATDLNNKKEERLKGMHIGNDSKVGRRLTNTTKIMGVDNLEKKEKLEIGKILMDVKLLPNKQKTGEYIMFSNRGKIMFPKNPKKINLEEGHRYDVKVIKDEGKYSIVEIIEKDTF